MNNLTEHENIRVLAILCYEGIFGGERANIQVMKLLRQQGADIECIVVKKGGYKFRSMLKQNGFICHNTHYGPSLFGLSNPIHYLKNITGMLFTSTKFLSITKSFKPTHIYVPNYIQFLYIWPALFFIKVPVIFRIGDPPEISWMHRVMWTKIISPKVMIFITNSKYTLNRLFQTGVHKHQAKVIRNCITRKDKNNIMDNRGYKGETRIIITYIGQINPQKGVDIAAEAAIKICKLYDNVRFQFFGTLDYNSKYVKTLLQNVAIEQLEGKIKFLGYCNDVVSILRASTLHLCPSIQEESSANVIIESKFAGTPSVVFRKGGMPELINNKINGYICSKANVEGLLEGILYYLEHPTELENASKMAKQSSLMFTEDEIGIEWFKLFQEVVS